jgi:predicted phage terminase large subunit-like protein
MRGFIKDSGVYEHIVEDKANGTAVIDVLREEIPGMIPVNPTNSKEARARAVTPEIESGNVYLPADAHWLPDFLSEMKAFNNGTHDDQVDAMTQALTRLRGGGNVIILQPQAVVSRGYQQQAVGRVRNA